MSYYFTNETEISCDTCGFVMGMQKAPVEIHRTIITNLDRIKTNCMPCHSKITPPPTVKS